MDSKVAAVRSNAARMSGWTWTSAITGSRRIPMRSRPGSRPQADKKVSVGVGA
ncbi:hypothetical protein HMPREF9597_00341 [Cutibacterium acnes HL005PA4]|nr:hypothetical protein HMPREF9597_00341 [Cutibacterium acnes HL005PA4]EGF71140.1 hypothetical protein HMPREF9588_01151 [Cutibacterium acnes HL025PA2]